MDHSSGALCAERSSERALANGGVNGLALGEAHRHQHELMAVG